MVKGTEDITNTKKRDINKLLCYVKNTNENETIKIYE